MGSIEYVCPFCLLRGMHVRLDRKGRPMLQCSTCTACIFARGSLAIRNVLETLRLLEVPQNLSFVRQAAFAAVERPIAELLVQPKLASGNVTTASADLPQAAAGGVR
jgi:hypothetical protein